MLIELTNARMKLGHQSFGPLNLAIDSGERIAILGKSGAGKSSILRLLARDYFLQSGHFRFKGLPIEDYSWVQLSRLRAVLPQNTQVGFGLTTDLIIGLGRVRALSQGDTQRIIQFASERANASHLLGRFFHTLSGGEQARIHLARIFAQLWDVENGLIFVDEPLSSLDPGLQYVLLAAIDHFAKERRHGVIAILHDINHALEFERLLLIEDGQIIRDIAANPDALPDLERLFGIRLEYVKDSQGNGALIQVGLRCTL